MQFSILSLRVVPSPYTQGGSFHPNYLNLSKPSKTHLDIVSLVSLKPVKLTALTEGMCFSTPQCSTFLSLTRIQVVLQEQEALLIFYETKPRHMAAYSTVYNNNSEYMFFILFFFFLFFLYMLCTVVLNRVQQSQALSIYMWMYIFYTLCEVSTNQEPLFY